MTIILSSFRARLEAAERDLVVEAMTVAHGSVGRAAELLALHPYQVRRIIARYELTDLITHKPGTWGNDAWRALA